MKARTRTSTAAVHMGSPGGTSPARARRGPWRIVSRAGLAGMLLGIAGQVLADAGLEARLADLREDRRAAAAGTQLASAPLLDDFYREREYRFAWDGSRRVDALLALAEASHGDGLRPADFHSDRIRALLSGRDPADLPEAERVEAELLLSDSLLRLIHHLRYGKVDPQALDRKWNQADGPYSPDLVQDLLQLVGGRDLRRAVEGLIELPPFYTRLREALAQYRQIASEGGWPSVPAGRKLEPGARDSRVPALRERLRVTGEHRGADPADPLRYDPPLVEAVRAFQERHYLLVDGIVGPATLAALNVTAEARIDQIRVNLERMRWVSDGLPQDYVLVDIPAQHAYLLRDGQPVWDSRVIVGRSDRPTPVFRDELTYLEFNPTWTVPPTILRKDILPAARNDPQAVRTKGLKVIDRNGRVVPPEEVDWHAPAGTFPYTLRQPPGDDNALGQVKFMFPNRFSVYLHDTNNRRLFDRSTRLYSSGCVRVERPFELAELLLDEPGRWNQDSFKKLVASGRTRTVRLKEPFPIILAYWTAEASADGRVRFRNDIYDRDAQLLAALDGETSLRLVYVDPRPKPEPAPAQSSPAEPVPVPAPEAVRARGGRDAPQLAAKVAPPVL